MIQQILPFACLCIGLTECAYSRGGPGGYPFDVPADPRSFAMGESFTGVTANPNALMYNPAGLAGLNGLNISFARRSLSGEHNSAISSFSATVGTAFGVFAAQYNRDSYGVLPETRSAEGPVPMETYDYDVAIGYGVRLGRGFAFGAAAKYYSFSGYTPDPSGSSLSSSATTPARLFDVGLTYTFRRFHSQAVVEDSITIGMSYQNIGNGWTKGHAGLRIDNLSPGIPQYFRAGLSYALKVVPREKGSVSPFEVVFSAELRSADSSPYPFWANSFWGVGMEFTVEEFLSLRAGGTNVDRDGAPVMRYGMAVLLPVHSLGFDLSLQYAVIPWDSHAAFSIDIQTSGSLF